MTIDSVCGYLSVIPAGVVGSFIDSDLVGLRLRRFSIVLNRLSICRILMVLIFCRLVLVE